MNKRIISIAALCVMLCNIASFSHASNRCEEKLTFRQRALNQKLLNKHTNSFSLELDSGKIGNQVNSNTCWLNAGISMLESSKRTFSRSYLLNYFLIEEAKKYLEQETPENILDSGNFSDFKHLVTKYGVVDSKLMPETESSVSPQLLILELNTYLASNISKKPNSTILKGVRKILAVHLGKVPRGRERFKKNLSKLKVPIEDFVLITSYPNFAYNKKNKQNLNLAIERLFELATSSVEKGFPVWFASDYERDIDETTGIMNPNIFLRDQAYGFGKENSFGHISRRTAYNAEISDPVHAMIINGIDQNLKTGAIIKFKVQNSWGTSVGNNGIFFLYKPWFFQNVYEVAVPKHLLNAEEKRLLQTS